LKNTQLFCVASSLSLFGTRRNLYIYIYLKPYTTDTMTKDKVSYIVGAFGPWVLYSRDCPAWGGYNGANASKEQKKQNQKQGPRGHAGHVAAEAALTLRLARSDRKRMRGEEEEEETLEEKNSAGAPLAKKRMS